MNNNKQQTAVDIAFEKLANQGLLVTRDYKNLVVYREAKEMEKKQIIEAYKYGNQSDVYFKPEQYYNETFNN
jgi:hypothetical protein